MEQNVLNPPHFNELPNAKTVLNMSIISSVSCFFGFLFFPFIVGFILSILALILGDMSQNVYRAYPGHFWTNYSTLRSGMVYAVIGFVLNGFFLSILIHAVIKDLTTR